MVGGFRGTRLIVNAGERGERAGLSASRPHQVAAWVLFCIGGQVQGDGVGPGGCNQTLLASCGTGSTRAAPCTVPCTATTTTATTRGTTSGSNGRSCWLSASPNWGRRNRRNGRNRSTDNDIFLRRHSGGNSLVQRGRRPSRRGGGSGSSRLSVQGQSLLCGTRGSYGGCGIRGARNIATLNTTEKETNISLKIITQVARNYGST